MGLAVGAAGAVGLRRRGRARQATTEDAGAIVRRLLEEPWRGGWDVIEASVSPDYVGHDGAEPEPIHGAAGIRAAIERYLAAFPDATVRVDEQVVEGERVATRWTARGVHTGELAGIAPTGKEVTVSGQTLSRLENGMVVEEWITWDTLGMLVQLGAVPAPARA